jgi:predicted MFS family arabinose efflux permease
MSVGPIEAPKIIRPRLLLVLLVIGYALNFVDRQIAGILAEPMKADLHLTDTQLGWIGGTAFAIFYTVLGIPVARLADRRDRSAILSAGLALWSLATAACGAAQNFGQLFVARMSVGIGEAAGVAPAYSLLSDLFPAEKRARTIAIFSLGIPFGSAIGVIFGGLVAAHISWRVAFLAVGAAGFLFAPIYKWGVRDPGHRPTTAQVTIAEVIATIARKPSFWLISIGSGIGSLVAYGLAFWIPSFFARSFALGLTERSWLFGGIQLVGGLAGIWLGGVIADRLRQRRPAAYVLVPAVTYALCFPVYLLVFESHSLLAASILFLLPTALSVAWLGPVIGAITMLVPSHMRATASAMFLFINNLVGLGLGTLFIGRLSDALATRFGAESLRYAAIGAVTLYLLAALLMVAACLYLRRDLDKQVSE